MQESLAYRRLKNRKMQEAKKNPDLTRFLITQGPGFFAATKRVAYKQPFTAA